MPKSVKITIDDTSFDAELNDSKTAALLYETLPTTLNLSRWGDEYYGGCGVASNDSEGAREIMEVGELAYWAPGSAFCIFFGPTPASSDERPRAASEVVPLGRITNAVEPLKAMGGSVTAKLEKAD